MNRTLSVLKPHNIDVKVLKRLMHSSFNVKKQNVFTKIHSTVMKDVGSKTHNVNVLYDGFPSLENKLFGPFLPASPTFAFFPLKGIIYFPNGTPLGYRL